MDLRALPEMYGLNGVILVLEGGLEEAVGEGTEAGSREEGEQSQHRRDVPSKRSQRQGGSGQRIPRGPPAVFCCVRPSNMFLSSHYMLEIQKYGAQTPASLTPTREINRLLKSYMRNENVNVFKEDQLLYDKKN